MKHNFNPEGVFLILLDWLKATGRVCALFLGVFAVVVAAQAGPEDGRIVNGSGSISHSGTHTDIHQQSDFLSTRWGSFNIGANESVQAHQPGASSRLLIRVDGGGATNIAGSYSSNGITILENRNGVQFSQGAIVNVGGLLATSSRIRGVRGNNWRLNGIGGAVVNHGTITAGAGGAILAAVKVQNTGDITAKGGDVALGAGSSFTVDFAGSMIGFEVTKAASGASITNSGKIEAQGGVVALSAQEAQAVRTNVISVGGVVKATRMERRGGVVYLSGGDEGVAEVSGDVQASKKVQTTGKYVAVKDGALLKAPKILVGGDFQGRGNVPTAQRTLVERGALLDAGAEGRVIVWSDDVTWFNGNINVPGGFAEVSGKRDLATVNLPGINVGSGDDAGTLLLDPLHISIVAADDSDTPLPLAGVLFEDAPGDGTDRTNISATDIGNFDGDLELQARGGIQVRASITNAGDLTSLTLRAQDNLGADGVVGGDGDDSDFTGMGDTNNISFFGTNTLNLGSANLTLIGGVVNIAAGNPTTITTTGTLTFHFTRGGVDQAAATGRVVGLTEGAGTTLIYELGPVALPQPAANPGTALDCTGQTDTCSITRTNEAVQISSGNLSADVSLTIDIGDGDLTFAGDVPIMVGAPVVSITAGTINTVGRALTITTISGALTLNTNINVGTADTAVLTLISGTGAIANDDSNNTLTASTVNLTQAADFPGTPPFAFANSVGAVNYVTTTTAFGANLRPWMIVEDRDLSVTANGSGTLGNITIPVTINIGTGALTLSTSRSINFFDALTLTAREVSLTGRITQSALNAEGRSVTINATGRVTLNSNINLGTTVNTLTINAGELIDIPNSITINAETFEINFTDDEGPTRAAADGFIIDSMDTFDNLSDTSTTPTIDYANPGVVVPPTGCGGAAVCALIQITGETGLDPDLNANDSITITANEQDSAVDAGDGTLTFSGGGDIMIGSTAITINAASIDIGTRALTITASGGALILNTDINADATSLEAVMLSTTGGVLALRGDINAGGGALSLSGGAGISLGGSGNMRTLRGAAITLIGEITRSGNVVGLDVAATGILALDDNINTGTGVLSLQGLTIALDGPTTLRGGAITLDGTITETGNDALTVTAIAALMLNDNINIGGGALSLEGTSIVLDGTTTLDGAAISLTGAVDGNFGLIVRAGGVLTLNSDINTGTTSDLLLRGMTIGLGGDGSTTISLEGRIVTLTGALTANAPALTITANSVIRLNDNISTGTGNLTLAGVGRVINLGTDVTSLSGGAITLGGAIMRTGNVALTVTATGALMLDGDNISIGAGNLSLEGGAGIMLGGIFTSLEGGLVTLTGAITRPSGTANLTVTATGVLTLNDDIDIGTGALSLTGTGSPMAIVLDGSVMLTGAAISLTGALTSGGNNLTIMASGDITLNSNINLGSGNLMLTATGSNIVTPGTPTLNAGEISLTHADTFTNNLFSIASATSLTIETTGMRVSQIVHAWMVSSGRTLDLTTTGVLTIGIDIPAGSGDLTLDGVSIVLSGSGTRALTGAAITLTGQIAVPSSATIDALTITAGGLLTLNSGIVLDMADDITLTGDGGIALGTNARTLTGAAITLTGALTSSNSLTINAGGLLTLNSDINLGSTGTTLAIIADDRIAVPGMDTDITAGIFTIEFTDPAVQDTDTGFGGTFDNLIGTAPTDPENPDDPIRFAPPLAADCTGQIGDCSLGVDGTDLLVVATLTLADLHTLTIDIGPAMLTFDGIGDIMITARDVTITAGTIDIDGRNLSIRTTNGKLTLNTSIINAGTLILFSATSSDPAIVLSRNTMLSGVNIDITGSINVQRNLTVMATDTLTLNSNISVLGNNTLSLTGMMGITLGNAIELVGALINLTGVIGGNNGLTIRTTNFRDNMLTLNSDINTGTGDLTLNVNDMGRIVLGSGLTSLRGAVVTLTGVVTRASGDANLGIMATGALTLNNNITISAMGTLTLMTGAGAIMNGDTARALTAGAVSLDQVDAFDPTAPFTFNSATSLTLTTDAAQTVHGWMVDTTNNRALSLTTTGAITVNDNIDTGTRALTLSAGTSIFLRGVGGARTLEGSAVTLTGILDSRVSGDGVAANNIIITAGNGNITISGDIIASGNDGVGFSNPGGAGGALTLMANSGNIMITGNFTAIGGVGGFVSSVGGVSGAGGAGGAVTLMAGNIMIGNINAGGGGVAPQRSQDANGGNGGAGGAVMITGTGTVQIGEIRANGVNGQGTTNDNNGGTGGAGGVITLQGASVSVRLINSVRGRGGVNQGEGSNGSDGVAGSVMITTTGGDLTLMGSINVSGGTLTLRAPGNNISVIGSVPTLTASTVTINQGAAFADNLIVAEATSLILTTDDPQIVRAWMTAGSNRSLSLTSSGAIIINADITLGTGNLTLIGMGGIQLGSVGNPRRLSGADVSLTGVINVATNNLIVTATGQLTLNSNINIGTRTLTLIAGTSGTGEIMNGGDMRQLNAGTVSLTQASAFDATFAGSSGRFTFASGVNSLVLDAGSAPQMVHDWMVFAGRSLDLTTTGEITIGGNIILGTGNLILDGGTLTFTGSQRILSGAAVSLSGNATNAGQLNITASGQLTLNSDITPAQDATGNLSVSGSGISVADGITLTSGGNLTLGGTMVATAAAGGNGSLTLTAAGTLALNTNINLGTGTAMLNAGSDEGFTGRSVITAATVNIVFSSTELTGLDDVPIIDPAASPPGVITFVDTDGNRVTPMIMFGARECDVADNCVISFDGALVVQHELTATNSITIEATDSGDGVSSVRFGGAGTITLTAPLVTIIAETINLEGRNLVIVHGTGATLTLSGNVSGAATINIQNDGSIDIVGPRTITGAGAVTLTAALIRTVDRALDVNTAAAHNLTITATGDLTIGAIDIGTGMLTLTAGMGGTGDIAAGVVTPTLTAGTVSLTQAGTFGDTALFMFATGTSGRLNLTTAASTPQEVQGWMFDVMDRALSLTSTGSRLVIRGSINIGAGDLFLSGTGSGTGIELDSGGTITLTGGAVTLTGNVDGTINGSNFTIMAGGILTLNGNITTNVSSNIMLTGTSIVLPADNGNRITLSGAAVTLTGAVDGNSLDDALDNDFTITATGDITINNDIDLGTGALILTATGANIVDVAVVVPVLTASTVSLTQAGTFAAGLFTVASATSLTLDAGSAAQTVHAWMVDGTNNRALSLTTTGAITIGRDIATGTSNLTLDGGTLTLTAATTLSGADIALTGAATGTDSLTITASGTLTLNSNITLTGSGLTLALSGAGAIGNGGSSTALAASTVSLDQVAEFDGTALFTFTADTLNLTTAAPQTVHGWMTSGDRSLNLTSTGGAITTGGIDTGMGDLTLDGTSIVISGFGGSLIGRNVVLTGAITGTRSDIAFVIRAMGDITINNNITFDTSQSTLTLVAGFGAGTGNIMATGTSFAARQIELTQTGAFAGPTPAFTITSPDLILTTGAAQTVYAWMVGPSRNLNLTSNGGSITVGTAITVNRNITLTATTININADIGTSSTPIAGSLTLNSDTLAFSGPRILSGANISLTGAATNAANLTITTTGTLTIAANIAITGGDLMLTGGTGGIVIGTATGAGALTLSGDVVTLVGAVTTASTAGAANSTDLTITAQGALSIAEVASIDLSNNDDTAHGDLVLIAGAGAQTGDIAFVVGGVGILNAASVELRQDTNFNATRPVIIQINSMPLADTGNPESVIISGDVQVPWAAILVTVGDLTIIDDGNDPDGTADNGIELDTARLAYTGLITIDAGALDITFATGLGNITWEARDITITAGSIVLGGRNLTIITESVITEDGTMEGGTLTLNVANITSTGNLSLTGETIQIGRGPDDAVGATRTLTGANITLTAANGIQIGRFTRGGDFRSNNDAANFTVNASGVLTIAADITVDGTATSGGDIALTGGSIDFGAAARTITSRAIRFTGAVTSAADLTITASGTLRADNNITLTGAGNDLTLTSTGGVLRILGNITTVGDITLSGVTDGINFRGGARILTSGAAITLTGAARSDQDLTITAASGILTINNDITLTGDDLTLTLNGAGAIVTTGRPRLTASTVDLTQIAAFAVARPFRFSAGASLVFMTGAAQDVHNWMIAPNSDLTITSSARVRVVMAIGASVPSRNLGTGNITLTSTGADIRIQGNISTTGNIILSGNTEINLNGGAGAKTFSGAVITLDGGTGDVVSNRDLTITASSILTLNNSIAAGTSALSLTGGMITLGSALTLSGGDVTLIGDVTSSANLTLTATGILTFVGDSIAIGSGNLSLTGATIRLGRASRGSELVGTTTLAGAAITLTTTAAEGVITVGRFNLSGRFIPEAAPALMVTASGVLAIAANITSVANITLVGGTGGIVIGTATGSSALIWRGSDITLTGAVTTASTAGIGNLTSLTLRASGNLMVAAIDLANDAVGSSPDAWGDLRLRAGVGGATTGVIAVTGVSTPINAGFILFEQDGAVFAAAAPATLSIDSVAVAATSRRSMVLVFYRGEGEQDNVTWGTMIGAGAIDLGTGDDVEIALNNDILLSLESITINAGTGAVTFAGTTGDITLIAPMITITAGSINTGSRNLTITTDGGTLTLNVESITSAGNLVFAATTINLGRPTSGRDPVGTITLTGAAITLTAANGIQLGRFTGRGEFRSNNDVTNFTVNATGVLTIAADITVAGGTSSGGDIDLTGGSIAFGTAARTITGAAITLMGAATSTADLTLTASGILTLNSDINTGAGALTLSGAGAIAIGSSAPELIASTVSLRQVDVFGATELFTFGSGTGSLVLITTDATDATDAVVDQSVQPWMINVGIDLTVMSPSRVLVATEITLGDGVITLTSTGADIGIGANITTTGAITLDSATGINTSGGARTLSGEGITLIGAVRSGGEDVIINANGGTLTLNGDVNTVNIVDDGDNTFGDLMLTGAVIQIGSVAGAPANTRILLRGENITLTSATTLVTNGIQIGRFTGRREFRDNRDVANLTVTAQGVLTIAADITVADGTSSGGNIQLTGRDTTTPTVFTGARTITGRAITLSGAATGAANLALTASGTLTLNNNITLTGDGLTLALSGAGTIVNGGGTDTTLTVNAASTVSLEQDAAFGTTAPFVFGTTTGSLALTTDAEQVVHDWMIASGRSLTVTSSDRVRVAAAIGPLEVDRALGTGSLTLTSGRRVLRISADITTTGAITLSGGTGGINLNGTDTLTGAAITLNGNARGNSDLILDATSGALTLNGDITTGTSALTLIGATISIMGDSDTTHTLSGGAIALTGVATGSANLTINPSDTLAINDNITLTGANLTLASSGAAALVVTGGSTLTALTVSLTQAPVFGDAPPFTVGMATGSLELTITAATGAQVVHSWMINDGVGLTVRSGRTVHVSEEIVATGDGARDIGAGNLTLISGGRVRIGADITTTGNIILTGVGSPAIRFESGARVVRGTNIRLNGSAGISTSTTIGGGNVTLEATGTTTMDGMPTDGILTFNGDIDTGTNTLSLSGAVIQIGRTSSEAVGATRTLSGGAITLTSATTSASGIEIGRFTGRGEFRPNNDAANLTVTASGVLTIAADITVADGTRSGGDIALTGGSIAFGDAARTITGRAIRLRGAATGTADLTITVSGTLRTDSSITLTGNTNPALTLMSTGGVVRILAALSTTGALTLNGATEINLRGGVAAGEMKTLNGAAITLTGAARSNRDLTITASGILTINNDITLTSSGPTGLTLALSGAGAIVATARPRLTASTVSLTQADTFTADAEGRGLFRFTSGSLMLDTGAAQVVHNWMISSSRDVTIMSAGQVSVADPIGADVSGRNLGARSLTLESMADIRIAADITTTGNITLNGATGINLNGGARTITGRAITLTGVAASDANVTITASGALTLNSNIDIGTNALTLTSGAGAIVGVGTPTLTASTVSLSQVAVFAATRLFTFADAVDSLVLTTDAAQVVEGWMIASDRNLTVIVRTGRAVRVSEEIVASGGSARDIGGGNLTLTSGGRVRIGANITTTGNIILTGVASSTQPAIRFENGARVVMGGNIRLNGPAGVLTSATSGASGGDVTLEANATSGILTLNGNVNTRFIAADGTTSFGDLTLTGATIQIGSIAGAPVNTRILLRGQNIMLTSANGILLGRFIGRGDFRVNNDVANLTVDAQGTSTIAADITVDGTARSGGNIQLRGRSTTAPIAFTDARTIIGRTIRLRGAATGTADLTLTTLTASGTLRIDNDINIGTNTLTLTSGVGAISNGGATGDNRPTLTAGTVSLAQVDEFAATRLFTFAAAIGSLEFETTVNQDVHTWMIFEDTNLTVTSSARVRVTAAIGSGGRNLGDGDLTLTSTGGVVRISADITTTGNIILSAVTSVDDGGGINLNGGARILNGAVITLTGAARGNGALTITATGVLTINNNINIGTDVDRILTLEAASFDIDSSVDLNAGSHSFTPTMACTPDTMPSCTVTP